MHYYIVGNKVVINETNAFETDRQLEAMLGEPLQQPFDLRLIDENKNPEIWESTKLSIYKHKPDIQLLETYKLTNLYHLAENRYQLLNVGRAMQVAHHFQTHQFCGQCGSSMQYNVAELLASCEQCGFNSYPRISPCMIVLVVQGRQVLLAKRPESDAKWYSLLAGFAEAGETLEQCVEREVFEEVKIKVKNIRYFGSQAWPFPNQLMVGYIADYGSGEIEIDEVEIGDAQWFDIDDLPPYPPNISISGKIIEYYRSLMIC